MKELSFDEFPETGYEDWKKLVQKELGDKKIETILWQNENGFDVQPYFVQSETYAEVKKPETWDLYQRISGDSVVHLNASLLKSLEGGVNAIGIHTCINSFEQLTLILKDIQIAFIAIHFTHPENPNELIGWVVQYCLEKKIETKALRGSCRIGSIKDGYSDQLNWIANASEKHFSLFKLILIDANDIHNRGGKAVHEIAYALGSGNQYLHDLIALGHKVDDVSAMLQFNFATGSSFFTEIAKYRAFRALWQTVVKQYNPVHDCTVQCFLHAETSGFFQTTKDHYNNILRATTQAMSAIIGGANSVDVIPSYERNRTESETALRISRNIQHLLIEESYLQQAGDVATGSYYVEALTGQLMKQAWELFLQIEKMGGILKGKKWLDGLVAEHLNIRRENIRDGKQVVVGVNKYQNKNEKAAPDADTNSLTGTMEQL